MMSLLGPSLVWATVISVNSDGSYSTEEARNYRQKADVSTVETVDLTTIDHDSEERKQNEHQSIQKGLMLNGLATSLEEITPDALEVEIFELTEKTLPSDLTTLDIELFAPEVAKFSTLLTKPRFERYIEIEAEKYNKIDRALIEAVIETESNFDVAAVSNKGAMGLMQLMPATANRHKVMDTFNAQENIRGGTAELAYLMDVYNNPALALAAYNAGQGAVDKYGGVPPYRETQEYVVKVLTKTYAKRAKARQDLIIENKTETSEPVTSKRELKSVMVYDY